jgi:1-acyl-sn-glycerol-3-phosphate acyltransferase
MNDRAPHAAGPSGARARPAPYRGALPELLRWICTAYLRLSGWKIMGDWPIAPKAVLVAAPHTSNWDGIYMLAAAAYFRITLRWMGKASLTHGPFGWLMTALGCVPVDRSARNDLVAQMCEAFAAHDRMLLAVPPEGTRSLTPEWKSGFYHIAHQASVPIILSILDYGTKTIRIDGTFTTTGDYDRDLVAIQSHYRHAVGKHPHKFRAGANA